MVEALGIEIGDSSVRCDRTRKIPQYARHEIPEAWLFDLKARCVEVYRRPSATGYELSPESFPDVKIAVGPIFA